MPKNKSPGGYAGTSLAQAIARAASKTASEGEEERQHTLASRRKGAPSTDPEYGKKARKSLKQAFGKS